MSGILVDSDVLIEVLRQRKSTVLYQWRDLADSGEAVYYSPVSLVELRHGMREQSARPLNFFFPRWPAFQLGKKSAGRRATISALSTKATALGSAMP